MPRFAAFFLPFCALLLFVAFGQSVVKADEAIAPPSRRDMIRTAMRAPTWRFVYCLEDGQDPTELKSFLQQMADKRPFGKEIDVVSCWDVSEAELRNNSYSVFGNIMPVSEPVYGDNGYNLIPNHERKADDVLLLPYLANPWNQDSAVIGFYLADDPARLTDLLRQEMEGGWNNFFWPNWAYELHAENGERIYGSFKDTTWAFDEAKEVVMKSPDVPVYDENGLRIFAYDGSTTSGAIELVSNGLTRINEAFSLPNSIDTAAYPEVRLYPNIERIGLRRGSMAPIQYDSENHVLHVVPGFVDDDNFLFDFATWQPFVIPSTALTQAGRISIARFQHELAGRMGPDPERYGQRLTEAFRIESTGIFGRPEQERPSQFIQEAKSRMAAIRTPGRVAPPERRPGPTTPLAGMTFAHEGYRVHNGYGGEKIKPSLDSLAKLNVNALAIVPYTSMRNPNKPTSLFIPDRAGSENDWATACSAREAHERGWFVLLKPQIWVGGGHWPGDVDFTTDEDWNAFFEHYTYWILHYAVLAEREGIEGLCLGTELVKTTGKHPERWREIIRKVRSVYGGQLTYAANWGEEFDNFTFWDDLDAIGLNSYYPIAEGDAPTDAELLDGARRWLTMAAEHSRKVDRPLWLTEVGYRSVTAAWQHPHAEAGDRKVSVVDQARCYNALWMAAAETPELRGAFVWKWPSYIGYDGGRRSPNRGFTPGGKLAADRMAEFYESW